MIWHRPHSIQLVPAELKPDTRDMLTRHVDTVERGLANLRAEEVRLNAEIADLTERLRQTLVSLEAFRLALDRLKDGQRVDDDHLRQEAIQDVEARCQ